MKLYWYFKNPQFAGANFKDTHLTFNFNDGKIKLYLKFNNKLSVKTDKIINEQDDDFLPTIAKLRNTTFCRDFESWLEFHDIAQQKLLESYYQTAPSEYMYHTSEKIKKLNKLFQCK